MTTETTTARDCFDQAANAGEDVTSARFTSLLEDLEVGLENLLTRDGQNAPSANLPMGGHKHTNVIDADSDTEYATWGQVNARLIPDVTSVSANYTVVAGDVGKIIRVDAASAAVAVALPNLGTSDEGYQITIKKSDVSTNDVTVEADGSDTINDEATYVLVEQYEGITLIWAGTEWITGGGGSATTLTGDGIVSALEALVGDAQFSYNFLSDTPASVGGFDLFADVVTHESDIATNDRWVFADRSAAGEPNRFATTANIKDAVAFDLHTDVPTAHSTPHTDDRMVITAEEETNDPMRYISLTQLHIFMRDSLDIHDAGWSQLTSPDALDRLAVADEGTSGDPMRYMTLGQIKTFSAFDLHDDVTSNLTSISTADRMLISDEGTGGDPQRYITVAQLDARFVSAFDIKDDVTQSAVIANTDRLIFSDEGTSGDPNRYTTFQNFRTALAIPASLGTDITAIS